MSRAKSLVVLDVEKQKQDIRNEVIEFILQGYRFSEVLEYLQITYNLTHRQAKFIYEESKKEILLLGDFDLDIIITQHIMYYEEAIRYFDEVGNFSAKGQAMQAKEKLLKLFEQENQHIEIENNVNIEIESQQLYNTQKLNTEEQNRLSELFKKVKQIT